MSELKPCPLQACGGEAALKHTKSMGGSAKEACHYIECKTCGLSLYEDLPPVENKENLVRVWNTRASGWQPIETAPRDGTECLLLTPGGVAIGAWEPKQEDGPEQPGHDEGWVGYGYSVDPVNWGRTRENGFGGADHWIYEASNQPTHWMPLPTPPAQ